MSKKVKTKQDKKTILKDVLKELKKKLKNKDYIYDYLSIDDDGIIKIHKTLQEAESEKAKKTDLEYYTKNELETNN